MPRSARHLVSTPRSAGRATVLGAPAAVRSARLLAICAALAAAGAALADVDLGIGRGDSVKGTFDPPAETETFRVTIPRGAKVTAKITGSKGAKGHVTLAEGGGPVVATGVASKPTSAAETLVHTTTASGAYVVSATSRDMTAGAYSLSVKWTTPKRPAGRVTVPGSGQQVFVFGADDGATATITASAAPGSAAIPRVLRIDGPSGFAATPGVGGTTPSVKVPATRLAGAGDYAILLENASATAGDVDVRVTLKTPKRKARKVDVTTAALGGSGTAVGVVVEAGGALIEVGDLGLGGGLDDISGASIAIPAGAVPSGTPIFIGNAPPLDPKGAPTPIGAPVSFGPDGQKFSTPVTITLPVSNTGVPEQDIAVFTRSGSGKVSEVDEPLTIDLGAGTVSFPASHFSDYVVVSTHAAPPPGANFFSVAAGLDAPRDVSTASLDSVPGSIYVIAEGSVLTAVTFAAATGYATEPYAGGGTQTADGTARLAFDFGGPVTAVYVEGDSVFAATSTAVYAINDITGTVTRGFGTGTAGDSGDGGPAIAAQIADCVDLGPGPSGFLLVDRASGRIRTLDLSGNAGTLAGTGTSSPGADGSDALLSSLDAPAGVAADFLQGDTYVAERGRVRRVAAGGSITTVAGSPLGTTGCAAPTGGATTALFMELSSIASYIDTETFQTNLFLADTGCAVIWRLKPGSDTLTLVAGTLGEPGFTSDGAGIALVDDPRGLLGFTENVFLFIDGGNGKLRQLVEAP